MIHRARNSELRVVARCGQGPEAVLLKRGMMSTINEFLMSAEYILSEETRTVLCERGICTLKRKYPDIQAVPVVNFTATSPSS